MTATDGAAASSGSELSAGAGWPAAELPLHVTERILCCISPLESARHATVCRSWAAVVSARLAAPVPALYVCTPPDNGSDRRGLVVSVPLDGSAGGARPAAAPSRVRSSDTNGLRCIGAAPSGRVAFASGWWSYDVVLVSPVTGALQSIHVGSPRLDPRHGRVLAGDSLFAVDVGTLMLWRQAPGGGAWSRRAVAATLHHVDGVLAAVDCNGCFYLLNQDGCLFTVDTTSPPPLRMDKLPVASLTGRFGAGFSVKDDGRLLESDGEVLFVRQLQLACKEAVATESCTPSVSVVAGFEVYRLDVKEQRWTRVNELASDRALFVSPGSSFAVRASATAGCRSNCIYFVGEKRDNYWNARRRGDGESASSWSWGVYSMEDRRVLFEHVVTEPGRSAEVLWFLPRVV